MSDPSQNPAPLANPPADRPTVPLPLGPRSKAAIGLIVLSTVAIAFSLVADLDRLSLADRLVNGERVTLAEANDSDDLVATSFIIYLVALFLSGITFLLWVSRAYRNTIALGVTRPRYGTRWVVAHWFIPIASLFRPKQSMNDIWRGSDPDLPNPTGGVSHLPVTPLIHWWWAFWLLSTFVGNYAGRVSLSTAGNPTADDFKTQSVAFVVTDVAELLSVPLAIAVVVAVTRRQETRRLAIERNDLTGMPQSSDDPPPPAPA